MSENLAARRLLDLIPAIMQRWDDRVRDEVSSAAEASEIVLRDSLAQMLEVMAKVLSNRTDPRTAARDLAYLTMHGKERANQISYSLDELILEFHILQEVVLEALEPDHLLDTRDRGVIIQYVNEMVRVAAGEFVRVQQTLQTYADRLAQTDRSKDEFLAMLGHELRNPLGAISTALFLLQEGPADPATQKSALELAARQARHMKHMLDDLAAKLRAGGFCSPSLKLVAVTGYAADPEALAAAGFDGHLSKPVDFEQLGEIFASVIAARREPPLP